MNQRRPLEELDLEDVIESAHDELDAHDFQRTLHQAQAAGEEAGWRAVRGWLFLVLLIAMGVAAVIGNARFAFVVPLLLLLALGPAIVASKLTVESDTEKETLLEALHEREARVPADERESVKAEGRS